MREFRHDDQTRLICPPTGGRYRATFYHDPDPVTPWDGDACVPFIVYRGDSSWFNDPARGFDLLDPFAHMSDALIARKLGEIVAAMPSGIGWKGVPLYSDAPSFDWFVKEEYEDRGLTLREARREWFAEYLGDGETSDHRLDTLAALWKLAGVPAAVYITHGYSQGDRHALLIVAHPEAVKTFGFERKDGKANFAAYQKACPNDFAHTARGYGAWAWGNVVGVVVERIDPTEWDLAELDAGDVSASDLNALSYCAGFDDNSVWGFYPQETQDGFAFESEYADAIAFAVEAAEGDSADRATEAAEAFAVEMIEARPDLAPQWLGA